MTLEVEGTGQKGSLRKTWLDCMLTVSAGPSDCIVFLGADYK